MLKRYLAFRGDDYYPSPGMGNFIESFDTVEEAIAAVISAEKSDFTSPEEELWVCTWGCVWDSEIRETVWDETNYIEESEE